MTTDTSSLPRSVLLTGVTGFLGKVVLDELLRRRPDDTIYVIVRRKADHSARRRFTAKVARSPMFADRESGWDARVHVIDGELAEPRCGLSDEDHDLVTANVTETIHCAASIEFDLPLAQACEANATAALEVLELARCMKQLRALVSVSTAYVTPHRDSPIAEEVPSVFDDPEGTYASILAGTADERAWLARTGHPNTYTFTKCLAEQLLAARRGRVPLRIVRPSIISACVSQPSVGWIDSRAALAGFVAAIGAGHMRVVLANHATKLDIVPCDEVALRVVDEAFASAASRSDLHVVHAVAGLERAVPIPTLATTTLNHFASRPDAKAPRLAYLGPPTLWYEISRWLHHELPARLAALLCALRGDARGRRRWLRGVDRLERTNRLFAYFTQRSFDFRTSVPLDGSFDPVSYCGAICGGISKHLMAPRLPDRA